MKELLKLFGVGKLFETAPVEDRRRTTDDRGDDRRRTTGDGRQRRGL